MLAEIHAPTPELTSSSNLFNCIGGRTRLREFLQKFYADVRDHQLLGPVFAQVVTDWPQHVENVVDFWSTVTGGPLFYSGPLYGKDLAVQLRPEHYLAWLDLWQRHCHMHLPANAAERMIAAARTMARRLNEKPSALSA